MSGVLQRDERAHGSENRFSREFCRAETGRMTVNVIEQFKKTMASSRGSFLA
jgi:hypothetical protein